MTQDAFQDQMSRNHCWGCGPTNEHGLQIKSHWSDDGQEAICNWQPWEYHWAGPKHLLNGGIISTLFDCHTVCTAIAAKARAESMAIDDLWYVTGTLQVIYLKPTPIDRPVTLRARIKEMKEKKTVVTCSLYSNGEECAQAETIAIRVPLEWYDAMKGS